MTTQPSVLILGYGNIARMDDGLGPKAIERLLEYSLPNVTTRSMMMINIEHAEEIREYDRVIFIDADTNGKEPYTFSQIQPQPAGHITSHHLKPEALMQIVEQMYRADTIGYVLGIRGYTFDGFGEELSPQAAKNLESAIDFLVQMIQNDEFGIEADTN